MQNYPASHLKSSSTGGLLWHAMCFLTQLRTMQLVSLISQKFCDNFSIPEVKSMPTSELLYPLLLHLMVLAQLAKA